MSAAFDLSSVTPARPGPVARAQAMVPHIEAAAARIEATKTLPVELLDALHEAAIFRTLLPSSCNGEESAPAVFVQVTEALARADASTAWCVGQASGCSMAAAYMKPEIAWEIWGGDPRAVLAWGAGPQGLAQVVDGGYLVNGTWAFASGGRHATWMGGHCRVRERDGSMRKLAGGELVERSMLFPKDRAAVVENWKVMGLRGTGSDTYSVTDLFVPDDYSVCRDTDEERRQSGPLYRFTTTHLYASGFAGVAMGIARGALEALKALAQEKTPQATTRMLRDSAVVQTQVALAEAKLGSARSFLLQTLGECWETAQHGELSLDQRMRIRLSATFATMQAREVVDIAYHEAGATAIFEENPFERRFRDVHAVSQQVQARTTHFETVGQHFLGMTPSLRFI